MKTLPRACFITIAVITNLNFLSPAQSQSNNANRTFPWKVVQIIVPSPAGSPPDARAREIAGRLGPLLGQAVIVVNKPGAGGAIGMQAAATSAPDGHVVVFCTDAPLTMNPSMYSELPYDPVKDFAPVMVAYRTPLMLVANPTLRANTLPELIQLAKSQPGKIYYGSAGTGTPPHILADLFKFKAGLDMIHVPYKGGPAATMALLAGDVSFTIDAPSQVLSLVKAGKLKALAVTGEKRLAALPDVPTFTESGIKGMQASWSAVLVPAGTSRETIERLNREFARAMKSQDLQPYYESIGLTVVASSPEELQKRISEETPRWREAVKRAGITAW